MGVEPTRRFRSSVLVVSLSCAAVLAFGSGCTIGRLYRGAPLRGEVSQLREGESTKSDVLRIFGPPDQITHQTDGDAFVYFRQQRNYAELRVQDPITCVDWFTYSREFDARDRLVVLFDFTGVVRGLAVDHQIDEMPLL